MVEVGDPGGQARRVFEALAALLAEAGGTLEDVVKLTIFVTSIGDWHAIEAVRRTVFAAEPPTSTLVEVVTLADPDLCIEVEAVASLPAAGA